MQALMKRYRSAMPAFLALALGLSGAGLAQDGSPGTFSLPPGPQPQQQPPSDVQGPVDSESTPPRRTDQPAERAPEPVVPTIAPVPVPAPEQRQEQPPRQRPAADPQRTERQAQPPVQPPRTQTDPAPAPQDAPADAAPAPAPGTPPPLPLPQPEISEPPSATPGDLAEDEPADGSLWLWLGAGLVALISLIAMGLRQRSAARSQSAPAPAPVVPTATVPTPPLRTPPAVPRPAPAAPPVRTPAPSAPFGTIQASGLTFKAAPAPAPAPTQKPAPMPPPPPEPVPTPGPRSAPAPQADAEPDAQPPRLLLDFTTLGVDVTLVNAIARYHLGITNMADIPVSDVALHGAVVQARRGMPPTIDPLRGDTLLPLLQKVEDIAPDATRRCEGQIRLPLEQIEPIEMQGRLLFVPVVHIWIGYSGPDGTRYAVTQSFVLGEESSPPGPRVGPLRLDLGPRRFTEVGQRPLVPA